jgi:two-component system, OmpR family, response regulator RstA
MGTETTKQLLLVEDDEKLAALVKEYLEKLGLKVDIEYRGDRAAKRIIEEKHDLVILDIMLPGKDGLTVCREVRDRYDGPILMLTALGEEVDEIVGLEIGADDYLSKPVSPRMLFARVKALLRRFERQSLSGNRVSANRLELGQFIIDASLRAAWIDGANLVLTTAEFDVLWFLADRSGEIVTREQLYSELRGIDWDGLDRSMDLRIARLRKKLEDAGASSTLIKSVRGAGYLLAVAS